jgi:prepilin-type N-terminal cleavage/methylation domain-containing protein
MRRARGFTLVEIAVVIVIAALILTLFAGLGTSLLAQQRRQTTANRLAAIDAALVQYVTLQKRLPCPADGSLQSGAENGVPGACAANQVNGVVPWFTIGLAPADIVDGWDRRITYRVDPQLTVAGGMDMSRCDPAGTGLPAGGLCNAIGCSSATLNNCTPPAAFLGAKGLAVRSVGGTALNTAGPPNTLAAYVLISHGESGGGGFLATGTLGASISTDGTEEQKNYANVAYTAGTSYYVDDQLSDVAGTTHFDDVMLRPTILSVVNRAGLGPRVQP